jgi:hypothetical protein
VKTSNARSALREWILTRNLHMRPEDLADDTSILKARIITSLHLMDLILFLEHIGASAMTPDRLHPGAFDTIDTICRTFLESDAA